MGKRGGKCGHCRGFLTVLNTAEGVLTLNQNACDVVGVRLDDAIEELLPQRVGSTSYYFDVSYIYI